LELGLFFTETVQNGGIGALIFRVDGGFGHLLEVGRAMILGFQKVSFLNLFSSCIYDRLIEVNNPGRGVGY